MHYIIKSSVATLILLIAASGARAQIFEKLRKKAQEKLENKVEQKIDAEMEKAADRMVEESWNTVFGSSAENGEDGKAAPFTLSSNVNTEDEYHFDVVTTMKIRTEDADGSSEPAMYMDMHFKEGAPYTGTRFRGGAMQQNSGDLFIIYDLKNSAMVMLMSNEKNKFSYAYDWQQALSTAAAASGDGGAEQPQNWEEMEEWNGYRPVGEKSIAGLECRGYRLENEQTVTEVWISHDNPYGMGTLFQAHANARQVKNTIPDTYPQGMLMEMTSEDLESGDKVFLKVIDIRKNADIHYAMADYPAMNRAKNSGN